MKPSVFDRLSRVLAAAPSRRATLAGLAGAMSGILLGRGAETDVAARPKVCRPLGRVCVPERGITCCAGVCRNGRCRCPKRQKICRGRCISRRRCCGKQCRRPRRDRCRGGAKRCRDQCRGGTKRCQGRCVPKAVCCGGCPVGLLCENGACVPPRCGTGAPCRVFVTSSRTTGNIGGLLGADAFCQAAANSSDRTSGGVYKAWLSANAQSPATRFVRNPGPYVLVDDAETIVAGNWAELTSGTLRAPIKVMETGLTASAVPWSDTLADGTAATPARNCAGWNTDNVNVYGRVGRTTSTNVDWSEDRGQYNHPCHELGTLYCFEQG